MIAKPTQRIMKVETEFWSSGSDCNTLCLLDHFKAPCQFM